MKYETPELVALPPAINAIQTMSFSKLFLTRPLDSLFPMNHNDTFPGYIDWED